MKTKKSVRILLSMLVILLIILPAQVILAQSADNVVTLEADAKKTVNVKDDAVPATKSNTESTEDVPVLVDDAKKKESTSPQPIKKTSWSTGAKVGLGVGAVVIVGGVIALASGGGGSDGGSSSSTSSNPPTADSLVSAWQANASQPGSGLTYTGTYQLYQGGSISYDLYISNGEHLTGGGSWTIEGYKLTVRTDHSIYSGSFAPGNTTSVTLNSNTGWSSTLSR